MAYPRKSKMEVAVSFMTPPPKSHSVVFLIQFTQVRSSQGRDYTHMGAGHLGSRLSHLGSVNARNDMERSLSNGGCSSFTSEYLKKIRGERIDKLRENGKERLVACSCSKEFSRKRVIGSRKGCLL